MEFFRKTLDPVFALAAIAILDIFLFLLLGAWTVGGGETMMTGLMAQAVLGDDLQRIPFWNIVFPPHADYWKIYISLGMFFGAFVGAVLSKEFYWRLPPRASAWLMITIDGLLMGMGVGLAARDFVKLKRLLHTDDAGVRAMRALVMSLSPRPGAAFAKSEANFVIPDVVVKKVRGKWVAALNESAMPKLRLNRIYADILTRNRDSSNQQLSAQLQEAKWLIRNVQQRFETILRVAQAIVERQRRFFEHGDVAMRPMVLREIATMLNLHESTISRVTTQKYMLTTRGTYELKYFFGSHVATDTGGAASATAIRALIKQLIAAEDVTTPLTDSKIADLLREQGIIVARRTVAKYREALQIPPVNLRKAP